MKCLSKTIGLVMFLWLPQLVGADVFGSLTLAPTTLFETSEYYTQNVAEFGVNMGTTKLSYAQWLLTDKTTNMSLGAAQIHDGYLRLRAPVWTSQKYHTTLTYEPRFYFPTHALKREHGFMFAVRNSFHFKRTLSKGLQFRVSETPIFHAYNLASYDSEGKQTANPVFENRVSAAFDLLFSPQLTFSLDLNFFVTRLRSTGTAEAKWSDYLGFSPSLSYSPLNELSLIFVFDTGNLVAEDALGNFILDDKNNDSLFQFLISLNF